LFFEPLIDWANNLDHIDLVKKFKFMYIFLTADKDVNKTIVFPLTILKISFKNSVTEEKLFFILHKSFGIYKIA
jgi:hypothetical protein